MTIQNNNTTTVAGTAGGTLLTVFANVHSEDLVKTAVLAFVGAAVSFIVSLAMKWITCEAEVEPRSQKSQLRRLHTIIYCLIRDIGWGFFAQTK
jgi:hypothetical protein